MSFFTVDARRVFLSGLVSNSKFATRKKKGETRSISFFYRNTTNARTDNFSEGRNSVLSRDATSIRVCGWINIARGA